MRDSFFWLERFSIECRKTKTKAITMANHNKREQQTNQWELEANTRTGEKRGKTRVIMSRLVLRLIGWVGGASFFKSIIELSKVTPKQFGITFDTQLKTALKHKRTKTATYFSLTSH